MDKKVDVDNAEKSLALLNDFCSKLNDISYKLEELTMNIMDNNLFISGSSQSTKNKFSDISSLTQCAFNNISIAYRLATECCNNEQNIISKQEINIPNALKDKLIDNLSFIYEQISRCMEKEDTKIINEDYPPIHNIGFQHLGSKFLLYSDFNLHELVATTLCVADKAGVMETNSNINVDVINPLKYVTFAHYGTVFSVSINIHHMPCIVKVCAYLPDNIVSLDYMLKLYKEKNK